MVGFGLRALEIEVSCLRFNAFVFSALGFLKDQGFRVEGLRFQGFRI